MSEYPSEIWITNETDWISFKRFGCSSINHDDCCPKYVRSDICDGLLEACLCALGHMTGNMDGDMDLGEPVEMLRAAIAKTAAAS